MSKAYTSNLTRDQFELLEPLLPKAKPGGRPCTACRQYTRQHKPSCILSSISALKMTAILILELLHYNGVAT